jgi:hypothetical protein
MFVEFPASLFLLLQQLPTKVPDLKLQHLDNGCVPMRLQEEKTMSITSILLKRRTKTHKRHQQLSCHAEG